MFVRLQGSQLVFNSATDKVQWANERGLLEKVGG